MLYRLACDLAAIGDDAVAVGQALGCGDLGNSFKDLGNQIAIGGVDCIGAANVGFGNYQNMHGRHGVDVAECVHPFVFINLCGGDFSCDDFAKNTIHIVFIPFCRAVLGV